jgi:hypothetical protein
MKTMVKFPQISKNGVMLRSPPVCSLLFAIFLTDAFLGSNCGKDMPYFNNNWFYTPIP